jgi:hypothetical protein
MCSFTDAGYLAWASAVGLASATLLTTVAAPLLAMLHAGFIGHPFLYRVTGTWVPPLVMVTISLTSGWFVGALHRRHRRAAVWAYAVFSNAWQLPRLYSLVRGALTDERFVPALASQCLEMVVLTAAIAFGGIALHRGADPVSLHLNDSFN